MLVLTRKIGEKIVIGDGSITVEIVGMSGNQVRLGIEAPKEISVNRQEVHERIQLENQKTEDDQDGNTGRG